MRDVARVFAKLMSEPVDVCIRMSTEQILKLQPDRTLYLRGFSGTGAAASLCQTSPTGFTVCGVFRDMADFCVLVLYDADNIFEHYSVKYLPDFNLSGMVLTFDLSYQNLQPIDSAKFSWIDWAQLDVLTTAGNPVQVRLWDYATLASGNYAVAQGTYNISAPGGCTIYDRRPAECRSFYCAWLTAAELGPAWKPTTASCPWSIASRRKPKSRWS